jgi:meckelin
MWRTLMIANEFDKMQYSRKNSIELNLVFLMLLLAINSTESNSQVNDNIVMGFANNCLLWFLVAGVQRLFRFMFYERYYTEPKGQRFIDLCTLAKISIFIMDERYHGYYLHCRSPYEFADCGMEKICDDMRNEASGSMVGRGLDSPGCPIGCQTFEIFTSEVFQKQFRKVSSINFNLLLCH